MKELFLDYGLFLAQAATVVVSFGLIVAFIVNAARRDRGAERLEIQHTNARYDHMKSALERELLSKKQFKAREKARKRDEKARANAAEKSDEAPRQRVFVLDFKGDIRASAVRSLREEVTALLTLSEPVDEVVVRLENPGGVAHEHGLAASQLLRLRDRNIPITIAVDKVAASGGYMMACVATRIVAAPFAILGSIGVLMQVPNFHRLLDTHGIDFEIVKGGEFKRTLTVFGKNSEADRAKAHEDVEEIHAIFKDFVLENRPNLDLGRVATGEHWYGVRAQELGLCDSIQTSDDYLMQRASEADVFELKFQVPKSMKDKLAGGVASVSERVLDGWWTREQRGRYTA